jgi:hypothetical protein
MGVTNDYEMNETSGTVAIDSVGSTNLTLAGGIAPAFNGGNGYTFNQTNGQYIAFPSSLQLTGSTYMVCVNVTAAFNNTPVYADILGPTGSDAGVSLNDLFNSFTFQTGAIPTILSSLQPVTIGTPACLTLVYGTLGSADQLWIGPIKLTLKNGRGNVALTTGTWGLGGHFHGLTGTIYKFTEAASIILPPDEIQHNALIEAERITTATSIAVASAPAKYQDGNVTAVLYGDSMTGNIPQYQNYLNLTVPGLTIYNNGQGSQTIASDVTNGIFNQASSLLTQITSVGNPTPNHFDVTYIGTNDLTQGVAGSTVYTNWKAAILPLYRAGFKTVALSITPNIQQNSTQNTQRLAFNTLLYSGGQWDALVDWANDPRWVNANFPYTTWNLFTPYTNDGLHPNLVNTSFGGAPAMAGRISTALNRLGLQGNGTQYVLSCATAVCDIDLSHGSTQQIVLTNNISVLKVINGNQGSNLDLTITQPASGGPFTVPAVAVGSGATATVTSAGVITLTAGGTGYDQNYMPAFVVSSLTCTTQPRYSSTITNGVIASIAILTAPVACSGTGTVQVVSTEPVWNNFNATAVNALAAGASLTQRFTFDGVGQSIN